MSADFTVPAVADAVAAALGDRELIIQGDRRIHLRPDRRAVDAAGVLPSLARAGLPHRAVVACGPRGRSGPPRHLRLQRQRVRRVDARRMAGTRRAVQRQLPLRQGRAALPARRRRRDRADLSRRVRTASRRGAARPARSCACSSRSPTAPATSCSTAPSTTRPSSRQAQPSRRRSQPSPDDLYVLYTGGTTGMPKGVLWRQHDIFVTSFGGRNLVTGEVMGSYERDRGARRRESGHEDHDPAAADARRRPMGRDDGDHHRAVAGLRVGGRPVGRRRSGRHHRTRGRLGGHRRRRRHRPAAARRDREGDGRHPVAGDRQRRGHC